MEGSPLSNMLGAWNKTKLDFFSVGIQFVVFGVLTCILRFEQEKAGAAFFGSNFVVLYLTVNGFNGNSCQRECCGVRDVLSS